MSLRDEIIDLLNDPDLDYISLEYNLSNGTDSDLINIDRDTDGAFIMCFNQHINGNFIDDVKPPLTGLTIDDIMEYLDDNPRNYSFLQAEFLPRSSKQIIQRGIHPEKRRR
jgi:hypothetical protein